jgi:hypothetical protein
MFIDTLPHDPDDLIERGYERCDESTSDPIRSVRYRKRINPDPATLFDFAKGYTHARWPAVAFDVTITYTLYISDDPFATWRENCDYSFEEVCLVVYDAREVESDDSDDEAREVQLTKIGERVIFPETLDELDRLAKMLGSRSESRILFLQTVT